MEPIRQSLHDPPVIMDEKYIQLVFYNVEDILNVNTQFLEQLIERVEQQQSESLGDIFLKKVCLMQLSLLLP